MCKPFGIIYKATNIINGKCYIGQTVQKLEYRKKVHISNALNGHDTFFYRAIRKYGEDYFEWEIIFECDSKIQMNEKEILYIRELKSHALENGYNLTFGGDGQLGIIPSENTKRKISASKIGVKRPEHVKEKIRNGHKGLKRAPFTEEHRLNMSLSQRKRYMQKNTSMN